MLDNPLLGLGMRIPFDGITAEHVRPAIGQLLEEAKAAVKAIVDFDGARTYANTLSALDDATEPLELAMTVVGHLESVATTDALRDAYNEVKPEVSSFYAGLPLDAGLYRALKDFAATDEAKALTGEQRRFLDNTLDDFKRHGAELPEEGKKRLDAITRELAEITSKYAQNVLDETAAYELIVEDESRLAGLPEGAKEAARASAESKGKAGWRFTLQAPSMIPALTHLEDRGIREQLYRAYNTRASAGERDNRGHIGRIVALRREKAKLLGYATFADLVLADRMAKTGKAALDFVQDLERRTRPAFDTENDALLAFAREREGDQDLALEPWDIGFYSEKQRIALYDFDEEALRPYFPMEAVIDGMFETAKRLYGVTVRENTDLPTWHETVKAYDLVDEDGAPLGAFYSDMFPREEKRGGAWMNGLISGVVKGGRVSPHLGLICGNLTPPVGNKPSLLLHSEVETLFHEFGHLLHHMLSRVEVRSLAGTNVAWDFVELPSQIMENWCWEKEALDLFARHYETNAPIPAELFDKMQRARTYRAAYAQMRQLGFATVDLLVHEAWDADQDGDILAYSRDVMQRFAPVPYPADYAFICSFGHLFASAVGYAAGYYSYKWAEVLDADAFTRFSKEGVFNAEVGRAFRDRVLARGDGDDPMKLYQDFMGREPSLDPLLVRSGLLPAPAA